MTKSSGFSIIELVIAISLSSFVLVGVATIAAQMARSQIEGIRSGTMTGWSLVSYLSMSKEIEDANVLAFPIANGASADSLLVCKNWSRVVAGRLNTDATPDVNGVPKGSVYVIQYCVDNTTDPPNLILRRYARVGVGVVCPDPGVPVACTAAPGGGWTETGVVGFRMEKLGGQDVFLRDNSIGGVRLRYVIGIGMSKQYNNTLD